MKKRILFLLLAGLLVFSGCKKEESKEPVNYDSIATLPPLKEQEPYVFPEEDKFLLFDSLVTTHMSEQQGNISLGLIDLNEESKYFEEISKELDLNLAANITDSTYTVVLYSESDVSATYFVAMNYSDPDDIFISYCLKSKTLEVTRNSYSAPVSDIEYYDEIKIKNANYEGTDLGVYDGELQLWGNYVRMVINSLNDQ